ncbi:hypothetical protein V8C86DRAFT_476045 [Haematococcus lacustris]
MYRTRAPVLSLLRATPNLIMQLLSHFPAVLFTERAQERVVSFISEQAAMVASKSLPEKDEMQMLLSIVAPVAIHHLISGSSRGVADLSQLRYAIGGAGSALAGLARMTILPFSSNLDSNQAPGLPPPSIMTATLTTSTGQALLSLTKHSPQPRRNSSDTQQRSSQQQTAQLQQLKARQTRLQRAASHGKAAFSLAPPRAIVGRTVGASAPPSASDHSMEDTACASNWLQCQLALQATLL